MSGYFWDDRFFENNEDYEEIRRMMNNCLERLVGNKREYAIYRFGLAGQKEHSIYETAEHFSIPIERVRTLDSSILRAMKIRMPTIRSRSSCLRKFLLDYWKDSYDNR
ncbi:MAG: hypothetical protein ACI4F9_07520 [Lachnospiraceae bacterium]